MLALAGASPSGALFHAFVYLATAVLAVPIAQRLGLGSVLGYLAAGALIGPAGLELVGDAESVMHFAEFGVVMMLFLIGLELRPRALWSMRVDVLGLGGLQLVVTGAALAGILVAFGVDVRAAVALGVTLALSSTAIVMQTLSERGLTESPAGRRAFAVLLFKDIAVIPILALLPLMAPVGAAGAPDPAPTQSRIDHLPGLVQAGVILAVIVGIVLGGKLLARPLFRAVASTRMRELFSAAALLIVVGIALLMGQVGLSAALGTFLAGVVLADSEYRHELEGDLAPFKGLLLGLFFITVGAQLDLDPARVEVLRKHGMPVFFGDATRPELLEAAGCARARLFVLTIEDPTHARLVAETVAHHFPDLPVVARAYDVRHAHTLRGAGVAATVCAAQGGGLAMGRAVLRAIGFDPYRAERAVRRFQGHDEETQALLFDALGDAERSLKIARLRTSGLDRLLDADEEALESLTREADAAWSTDALIAKGR